MSLTLTNHSDGVLRVIVDATGNNSLHTFLLLFTDLIEGASHGTPGPVCTLPFGLFFPNCMYPLIYCILLFV